MGNLTKGRVVVLGLGYVGLPLALACLEHGHTVMGVDRDAARLEGLRGGKSFTSDVSDGRLSQALSSGRLQLSIDLPAQSSFDIGVITVPTPLDGENPDLSFIHDAARSIGESLEDGNLVILESTSFPGTTEQELVPVLEQHSGLRAGVDFQVGFSPERVDPGNSEWNLSNTPRIVAGIDDASRTAVKNFYQGLGVPTTEVSGVMEAEFAKLIENTFRAVNIAMINELAIYAAAARIDIWEAIEAANTKPYGFLKFTPGPGVGGHCIPVDPEYLSWSAEKTMGSRLASVEFAKSISVRVLDSVCDRASSTLAEHGMTLSTARVLVFGLAYKANSADIRNSPSIEIVKKLSARGASVEVVDAEVPGTVWPSEITRWGGRDFSDFDMAILLVAHSSLPVKRLLDSKLPILDIVQALRSQ